MYKRKIFAVIAAMAVLTSCSSVKNTMEISSDTPVGEVSQAAEENVFDPTQFADCYKAEEFKGPEGMRVVGSIMAFPNSDTVLIGRVDDEEHPMLFRTDKSFSEYTPMEYAVPEYAADADFYSFNPCFSIDGSFAGILDMQDHGGVKFPEHRDDSFDYGAFWENYTSTYKILKYDAEGRLTGECDFSYPEGFDDGWGNVYCQAVAYDGKCLYLADPQGGIWQADGAGNVSKIFETEKGGSDDWADVSLTTDRDGVLICTIMTSTLNSDNGYEYECKAYELKNGAFSEIEVGLSGEFGDALVTGAGKYRFFISRNDGLYGCCDDGSTESVLNWINSSISRMNIAALGEDEFIGYESGDRRFTRLTPRDMSEFANATVVTIASPYSYTFEEDRDMINQFNRSHDDCILRVMTVPDSNGSNDMNAFNMMLLSGNVPDIIYDINYDTFVNYRGKGIFADMYELMENGEGAKKGDMMGNVLSALEAPDGKLYGICRSFGIATLATKATTYDKENWSLDEFIALHDNAPDNFTHLYDGFTNMDMLKTLTYAMTDMIDWDKAECHFDSPEFVKLLEFCGRYVNEVTMPDKSNDDEFHNYYDDYYHFLANDKVMFEKTSIQNHRFVQYFQADGAELVYAGYPSTDGRGGIILPGTLMGITAASEHKDAAWEVVEFFLNYVPRNNGYNADINFYILTERFEKSLNNLANANQSYSGWEAPKLTEETKAMIDRYVKSCTKLGYSDRETFCAFDKDVMGVIEEEAMLYFGGDQTAEKAAANIQNRLSILVSERG